MVYGVCLNDFLERDGRQPSSPSFLPAKLSRFLTRRTRVARLVDERAEALKRTLGLAPDFYSDLFADFDARYQRFGADVAAMNALVTGAGLPPMVAMVLDQNPNLTGSGRKLALAAEHQLKAAGIDVVASDDFYRRHDGHNFRVSRWEGHPNEEAHAIWASDLAEHLDRHPALAPFARDARLAGDQDRH